MWWCGDVVMWWYGDVMMWWCGDTVMWWCGDDVVMRWWKIIHCTKDKKNTISYSLHFQYFNFKTHPIPPLFYLVFYQFRQAFLEKLRLWLHICKTETDEVKTNNKKSGNRKAKRTKKSNQCNSMKVPEKQLYQILKITQLKLSE